MTPVPGHKIPPGKEVNMFNFRLVVIGVLLALALVAVFVAQEATAGAPAGDSNALSPARRLLNLERMNDADNLGGTRTISPLPYLPVKGEREGNSAGGTRSRRW